MHTTKSLAIICVLLGLTLSVGSTYAITGNYKPDNVHSCVGLAVYYIIDADGNAVPVQVSSAVLISPRAALTAAHSAVVESVALCFDAGPITWTVEDGELVLDGVTAVYTGLAYPNPEFAMNLQGQGSISSVVYRDVGLIVLDEAVPSTVVSEYGQLPTAGLVDSLKVNTPVTLVGYGMQEHLSPRKVGVENTWVGLLMRTSASSKLLSNNFAWSDEFIRCSANPGNGRGGIAYGDSGGPVFLGNTTVILAVNSYVTNPNCAGQTYHSRIDIPEVLDWINVEVNSID